MTRIFDGLAETIEDAIGTITGLVLLIAIAPLLLHMTGLLLLLVLGAPHWVVVAMLFGIH